MESKEKPSIFNRSCISCQVEIANEEVKFSYGPPGTLNRLWARVCKYSQAAGKPCANHLTCDTANPKATDYYATGLIAFEAELLAHGIQWK